MFKGGFEGDFSEGKSTTLYRGTKKSGVVAFTLKKDDKPKRLMYGELEVDLF